MLDKLNKSPDLGMLQCELFITNFEKQLLVYPIWERSAASPLYCIISNWLLIVQARQEVPATRYETALTYSVDKISTVIYWDYPYYVQLPGGHIEQIFWCKDEVLL